MIPLIRVPRVTLSVPAVAAQLSGCPGAIIRITRTQHCPAPRGRECYRWFYSQLLQIYLVIPREKIQIERGRTFSFCNLSSAEEAIGLNCVLFYFQSVSVSKKQTKLLKSAAS